MQRSVPVEDTAKEVMQQKDLPDTTAPEPGNDFVYPSGMKLVLLMTSIFIGMFLVALVSGKQPSPVSQIT